MPIAISGTTGITLSGQFDSASSFGFKNRIINGAMVIDQRNAGTATANTISGYTLDRWAVAQSTTGKLIAQQNAGSVTPPTGFTKYLGITSQSAYSILVGDYYLIQQAIEGVNIADLAWGTASAATVTLSFWVRSSLTGTFGGSLRNSASNRCYPFSYTISSANTWEQKTITVVGDTTGTWVIDSTAAGIWLLLGLGVGSTYGSGTAGAWVGSTVFVPSGSTSVVGTNGATFYITGVQLEKGSTATSFDYRPYGTELQLAQRYYEKTYNIDVAPASITAVGQVDIYGSSDATSNSVATFPFKVTKRTTPTTITFYNAASGASGTWSYRRSGASGTGTASNLSTGANSIGLFIPVGAAWIVCEIYGHYTVDAEL